MLQLINYKKSQIVKFTQENKVSFKRFDNLLSLTQTSLFLFSPCNKNAFIQKMIGILPNKLKIVKKKLFLKGLGYKVIFENKSLIFKLNFSHNIVMEVPNYITRIVVGKTKIVFESYDSILLGNFIEKIYNLRPKDNYKRKGFSLSSKVVPKKEIKKK